MVKIISFIRNFLTAATALILILMIYGFYSVPDEMHCVSGENILAGNIYTVTYNQNGEDKTLSPGIKEGRYNISVSLFNAIPIKNSSLTISSRRYVVPGGEIFGLRLFTSGVIITKTETVDSPQGNVSPCDNAGLKKGDIIMKIDGEAVDSSNTVSQRLSRSDKQSFTVEYERDGKALTTQLTTAYSVSQGKYKAGMWIRDSAAGIGTLTFYDGATGSFAGLGHAVCDIDTGEILPFGDGDIVSAEITGCRKGEKGKAGELCGAFSFSRTGILLSNNEIGVYGIMTGKYCKGKELPVAFSDEVSQGRAQIISTIDRGEKEYYDIEILKINPDNPDNKNMIIKVTDEELIEKTGGIVQGMSGSPIIQKGRLVGAVTHVLINDPTKGYGIFAEKMLSEALSSAEEYHLRQAS